ncbi:MAG: hypothetical protein JWQ35_1817 [Bacteriovoracaceae bacterium]|nr:hypothetical protein [Bacteriovoracaceae bacterium]
MTASKIKIEQLSELQDQEVGAFGEIALDFHPSEKQFLACVPRESFPLPKTFSEELVSKIFPKDQLSALKKCDTKDCKFNFLPAEVRDIEQASDLAERQKLFFKFYEQRTQGLKGIDPKRSALFVRSKNHGFEDCEGSEFQKLLNERPLKNHPFRMSVVKYTDKMQTTTRLLQGISWKNQNTFCSAEALIFSDHYDVDLVSVWSLKREGDHDVLKFQIRNRIDILNTWMRRQIAKEKFRKQARQVAFSQIAEVEACLQKERKVNVSKPEASKLVTPTKNHKK